MTSTPDAPEPARPARRPFRPTALPVREKPRARFPWTGVAIAAGLLTMSMFAWGWLISTSQVGIALLVIPILLLVSAPIFVKASREEPRFDLGGLLALGLIVRCAAAYYRYNNASDGCGVPLLGYAARTVFGS